MVDYGRKRFNLNIKYGDFLKTKIEEKFDAMAFRLSIEHMKNPLSYIKKAKNVVKNGGILFITTLNVDSFPAKVCGKAWEWMTPPAHLFFFSPKTIKIFLEKENFKILKINTRRGDASGLFFSIAAAIAFRFGFWNFLKKVFVREKVENKNNLRYNYFSFLKLSEMLNIPFLPLEFFLNTINKSPEMIIFAKKI